ncbi:radical SAM/SPASM domain-containing protein [Candidatus Cardinium hertigii]|uniref:Radical SAM protein n=1 Tax=Candidatus Cardinium hertigii TaxID=247481 RepID=A0A2Z3LC70_9BACT|nr:radical SAM/SPASM domain-containing protein [Candidatus Cardinium hertigii]AWN81772.1 hypothetical protein DK880_00446 [Candidatus Cardinium hertigii]
MKQKIDIIWNTTLLCMWDCPICCVDAVHVRSKGDNIYIASKGLTKIDVIPKRKELSIFDQALTFRQTQGLELNLKEKLTILAHLSAFDSKIDFSGGDPMALSENLEVIKEASKMFGRNNITMTATGAGLARVDPSKIIDFIGELNITYDRASSIINQERPKQYATSNLVWGRKYKELGMKIRAEIPLTSDNLNDEAALKKLYVHLHEANIDTLLVMRFFSVGRGHNLTETTPTPKQYRQAINIFKLLEKEYGYPKIKLQCALKFFDDDYKDTLKINPCDAVRTSFGLMPDETLLASPWAINNRGKPLDDVWILGNLLKEPLESILAQEKAKVFLRRQNENFGQCKIHAFLASRKEKKIDRIFDTQDPLYVHAGG